MSAAELQPTEEPQTPPPPPRPQAETLLYRALRLKCPRCGKGHLYARWFRMNKRCPKCHFLIDRLEGYYLGSMYINYGITALITTVIFLTGRIGYGISGNSLVWPLGAFCLTFPALFFRHARALWLAMDCLFDASVLSGEDDLYSGEED